MADDQNPWSLEGWSLTAQMAYVSRYGMARAQARARDAGTTVGGRPAAPKAAVAKPPRDASPSNPWSPDGWSRTAQAQYVAAHGLARAEARARDAGTTVMGQPAPRAGTMAPAALVRPGSGAIYRVPPDGAAFIPPRRRPASSGTLPRVAIALGLTEANALQITAPEADIPAQTDALGIVMAALMRIEADLAAANALGVSMAAAVDHNTISISASEALGLTMISPVDHNTINTPASEALGISVAAAVDKNTINTPASEALGLTMVSPVDKNTINTPASVDLGVSLYTFQSTVNFVSEFFDGTGGHVEVRLVSIAGLDNTSLLTIINCPVPEANGTWAIDISPGGNFVNLQGSPVPSSTGVSTGTAYANGMLYTEQDIFTDFRIDESVNYRITESGDYRVTFDGANRNDLGVSITAALTIGSTALLSATEALGIIEAVSMFIIAPGSSTFNSGSGNFTVPNYTTLTVETWGPGASGGNESGAGAGLNGNDGGTTTCSTLGLTANGGHGATGSGATGGTAGTASGGNTTNTTGTAGSNPAGTNSGAGGAGANGGAGGASTAGASNSANDGVAPGGGGSGFAGTVAGHPNQVFAGGGGGGYSKSVYTLGVGGAPAVGALLAFAVGAGGAAVSGGTGPSGAGAAGRVKFTWA